MESDMLWSCVDGMRYIWRLDIGSGSIEGTGMGTDKFKLVSGEYSGEENGGHDLEGMLMKSLLIQATFNDCVSLISSITNMRHMMANLGSFHKGTDACS